MTDLSDSSTKMRHGTTSMYVYAKCRCDQCRKANADYKRRYRKANPEKTAIDSAKGRAAHPNRTAEHRAANPDLYRRYARESYERDRPKYLARASAHSKTARGRLMASVDRERRRGVPLTPEALAYIPIIQTDPCVYCGAPSTAVDHIHPVIYGGDSDWLNLAPVCGSCNSRKHTRSLLHFLLIKSR